MDALRQWQEDNPGKPPICLIVGGERIWGKISWDRERQLWLVYATESLIVVKPEDVQAIEFPKED